MAGAREISREYQLSLTDSASTSVSLLRERFCIERSDLQDFQEESSVDSDGLLDRLVDCGGYTREEGPRVPAQEMLRPVFVLPRWARPHIIMELAWQFAHDPDPKFVPLGVAAGEAVLMGFFVNLCRWFFLVAFCIVVWQTTYCEPSQRPNYSWIVWLIQLPVQCFITVFEVWMFTYIAVPKFQVLFPRGIVHCGLKISFWVWFLIRLIWSWVASLDHTSDSLFLGVQLSSQNCVWGDLLEAKWQSIYQKSMWKPILPSYVSACVICFCLNALPVVYSLLLGYYPPCNAASLCASEEDSIYQVPWNMDSSKCEVIEQDDYGNVSKNPRKWKLSKDTFLVENQNHGAALMALAEVNCLKLIDFYDLEYALAKAEVFIKLFDDQPDTEHLIAECNHITSQMNRCVIHTICSGLLANSQQVMLQTLSLAMYMGGPHMGFHGFQTFLSICLSVIALLSRIREGIRVSWHGFEWYQRLRLKGIDEERPEFTRLIRLTNCLAASVFLCLFFLTLAVVKLLMMRECPRAVWTLRGCWVPDADYLVRCKALANQTDIPDAFIAKHCV